MTGPRIGSLFSGYGGLESGIREVYPDATVAWHAEFDRDPSRILAHHWPDVPNYGDVTKIDWHAVEPVDIICGGSPCQDLSHAGKRAGMRAGTRSGLWASMCDAIEIIRPALVVWENVRGALSAGADSAVEPCPFCVGDKPGTTLRALGRVLGDLAELGYDATWGVVRAADAGAPHGRARIFIVATPDADGGGWEGRGQVGSGGSGRGPGRFGWVAGAGSHATPDAHHVRPLPTPEGSAARREGARVRPASQCDLVSVQRPTCGAAARPARPSPGGPVRSFGPYQRALDNWAAITGRAMPAPTERGRNGARLAAPFVEWLMGLPTGHVTDVPDLTRNAQLKALGNGVVPQQAALAIRTLLNVRSAAA